MATLEKKQQFGNYARPRRASATAPLRTGADTCKTGSGAGKRAGAESETVHRRSNHARTEDQAGKRKRANIDAVGGWRVHTADDTPTRIAATRSKRCAFMCQGDIRPRAAAGSSRNGTLQAREAVPFKPGWQQQRGYDWTETLPATPPLHGPTQSTPEKDHPGEG